MLLSKFLICVFFKVSFVRGLHPTMHMDLCWALLLAGFGGPARTLIFCRQKCGTQSLSVWFLIAIASYEPFCQKSMSSGKI